MIMNISKLCGGLQPVDRTLRPTEELTPKMAVIES